MDLNRNLQLRYVDAGDVTPDPIDFEGLDVRGKEDEKLGDVEGFIIDIDAGASRLHYVVVDSGGWFSSRSYLVPASHTHLDREAGALRVELTKDTIAGYPEYSPERFARLSDDELWRYEGELATVCCPDDAGRLTTPAAWDAQTWPHYRAPDWWTADRTTGYEGQEWTEPAEQPITTHQTPEDSRSRRSPSGRPNPEAERAQPGDVLGIERGGETTTLGDTAEDEDERRREGERVQPEFRDRR